MTNLINAPAHVALFRTKAEYLAFTKQWKILAHQKKLNRNDCLLRCILLQKDIQKSLPPTKNKIRLQNGSSQNSGLVHAVRALLQANPVQARLTREARLKVWELRGKPVPAWDAATPSWIEQWTSSAEGEDPLATIPHDLLALVKTVVNELKPV